MIPTAEIDIVGLHPRGELLERLKDVTMLTDKNTKPYADSKILLSLKTNVSSLAPAQLYVLASEYTKVMTLRHLMKYQHGIDILRLGLSQVSLPGGGTDLGGFVEFRVRYEEDPELACLHNYDPDQIITILPPIIERSFELDNETYNIINDGMHRCYLGRVTRSPVDVVMVDNVSVKHPYYAYPLPRGWDDVTLVQTLTGTPLKKFHRLPEPLYKSLYRDFNSVFTNVGGPRGK